MKSSGRFPAFLSIALVGSWVLSSFASSARPSDSVSGANGLVASARSDSKNRPYSSQPSKDAIKWADKQLKKMSLEEKIGQLISVGINATFLNQDSEAFRSLKRQVEENHIGGVILFRGPVYESVVLMNRMQQLAKYPLL